MQKQIFVNGNYDFDYDKIVFDGGVSHSLYYCNGEQWTDACKGTIILTGLDDGNGISYDFSANKGTQNLDYHQAMALTIIMKIMHSEYIFEIGDKKII